MSRKMVDEEEPQDRKVASIHPDCKANYSIIYDYEMSIPQGYEWMPGTDKPLSYRFHTEKAFIDGKNYPWIFYVSAYKQNPYKHWVNPILIHQNKMDFIHYFKLRFPFGYLIEKIISG